MTLRDRVAIVTGGSRGTTPAGDVWIPAQHRRDWRTDAGRGVLMQRAGRCRRGRNEDIVTSDVAALREGREVFARTKGQG